MRSIPGTVTEYPRQWLIDLLAKKGPQTMPEIIRTSHRKSTEVRKLIGKMMVAPIEGEHQICRYRKNRPTHYGLHLPGVHEMGNPEILYRTFLADPAWSYNDKTCRGASRRHYQVMTVEEVAALPVRQRTLPNAHLYLWIPKDILLDAAHLPVLKAWGFRHIHLLHWVKAKRFEKKVTCPCGCGHRFIVMDEKGRTLQMGLGRYFRGTGEYLIFAVRGRAPIEPAKRMLDLFFHPRTSKHSRKPPEFRADLEPVSKGPRIELFSEADVEGWDHWGKARAGLGYKKKMQPSRTRVVG